MRQSFENHEAELKAGCEAANRVVNSGGSAEQALQQLGTLAKGLVQDEIVNGDLDVYKRQRQRLCPGRPRRHEDW